jgi:hypothetical protein
MEFNDLLRESAIRPETVLVLRHSPKEPFRKVLRWLASDQPDAFNAYQATQNPRAETAMSNATHVAAFIGHEPKKALFVGLYRQCGGRKKSREELENLQVYQELRRLGFEDSADTRPTLTLFDLQLMDDLSNWKGRLIVIWPGPELSWLGQR